MILLDTSGLLSAIDESQRLHAHVIEALRKARGPYLLSPFVLAELDHLIATRIGHTEQIALLEEVARGAYALEPFSAVDIAQASEVLAKYADLEIGLADASIVVLAQRHGARDVLTLDERHFRALRPAPGKRFRILPADL